MLASELLSSYCIRTPTVCSIERHPHNRCKGHQWCGLLLLKMKLRMVQRRMNTPWLLQGSYHMNGTVLDCSRMFLDPSNVMTWRDAGNYLVLVEELEVAFIIQNGGVIKLLMTKSPAKQCKIAEHGDPLYTNLQSGKSSYFVMKISSWHHTISDVISNLEAHI